MERFQEARDRAQTRLRIADHMLTQTYPLVRDTKLLLAVIENIFLGLTSTMAALLYYERTFKRVPPFVDNFENKFHIFKEVCRRYNFPKQHILLIKNVKDLIVAHKKSPVEFARKDCFVICSEKYDMQTITTGKIKEYIVQSKELLRDVSQILVKNEGIFR